MPKWRVTIALKLFLAVLLTVLLITTVSLFVSQWTMQKNFSRYVTQVEMQKLDHLNNNLAEIYQVYGSWTEAIENSLTRLDTDISEERKHRFATMWLLKQYEIAQRQNDLIKNPALFQNRIDQQSPTIDRFMPSHFDPFARPPEQPQNQQPSKDNDQANPSHTRPNSNAVGLFRYLTV